MESSSSFIIFKKHSTNIFCICSDLIALFNKVIEKGILLLINLCEFTILKSKYLNISLILLIKICSI